MLGRADVGDDRLERLPQDGVACTTPCRRGSSTRTCSARRRTARCTSGSARPRRRRAARRSRRRLAGASRIPKIGMPMPPSLSTTFGHAATSAIDTRHSARTSSRRPAYGPMPSGPPRWSSTIGTSGMARPSVDQLGELRVVHPGVEAEPGGAERGDAAAEVGLPEQPGRRLGVRLADVGAGVEGAGVADAPEPTLHRRPRGRPGRRRSPARSGRRSRRCRRRTRRGRRRRRTRSRRRAGTPRARRCGSPTRTRRTPSSRRRGRSPCRRAAPASCTGSGVLPEVVVGVDDHAGAYVSRKRRSSVEVRGAVGARVVDQVADAVHPDDLDLRAGGGEAARRARRRTRRRARGRAAAARRGRRSARAGS